MLIYGRHYAAMLLVVVIGLWSSAISAQNIRDTSQNIEATLIAGGPAQPGKTVTLAIQFRPVSREWHGYWKNPGDAGYGMQLDWKLPDGWSAGEPLYPVPQRLLISDLMNHVYSGSYAVLIPLSVPDNAMENGAVSIRVAAQWLACTDRICVPEGDELSLVLPMGQASSTDPRVVEWRAAIPPMLDQSGTFDLVDKMLRLSIPVPASFELFDPHIFIAVPDVVQYAAKQRFFRKGDVLIAEIPLSHPDTDLANIEAILSFGGSEGIGFTARRGDVPPSNMFLTGRPATMPALGLILLAALAGGLMLNIMPCVFPILSLKALSLIRAGGSETEARQEAVAYTVGVILACTALGGIMLALRAAGEQVGWAFQLQEPGVVVGLLALSVVITANFAGVFELPSLSRTRSGKPASAFATGLLAATAATPCTGPFMAAAVGAAVLLPAGEALLLFAVLGLGLALPFLLIGLVPAIRMLLPRPGPWLERFRKAMAIPMGLTALALIWLVSRLGGQSFALITMVLILGLLVALMVVGRLQRQGKMAWPALGLIAAPFVVFALFALPASYSQSKPDSAESILNPQPYSAKNLARARGSGQPVFVWLTADWCVTCKVNEQVAIEREATRIAFAKSGVIAIRGDWTRRDAAITTYLTEHGAAGVPLYVWYAPGQAAEILPQVLTPRTLVNLAEGALPRAAGSDQ